MVAIATLASCSQNRIKINSPIDEVTGQGQSEIEIKRSPPYFIGVYNVDGVDIEGEAFVAKTGIFPEGLKAEMSPGRTTWFGWIIDKKGGEHELQIIFTPWGELIRRSDGKTEVAMYSTLVYSKSIEEGMAIAFSTMQEFGFNLLGREKNGFPLDWERFKKDFQFRKEIIAKHGTELSKLPVAEHFYASVKKWRPYTTPEGWKFFSPLSTADMKEVARINPGDTFFQRWIKEGEFYISPDLYSMGISAFFDLYRASEKKPIAWSMGGSINRQDMLFVNKYLSEIERMIIINQLQQGG
jgi:hypothetical protein